MGVVPFAIFVDFEIWFFRCFVGPRHEAVSY
jgi:hypothetical protein